MRGEPRWKHLKQIYIYGRDIAWHTKKEFTFDKLVFSLLSGGVLFFLVGLTSSFFYPFIRNWFLVIILIYMLIMLLVSININIKTSFNVWIIGMGTHFAYGFGWLKGIFSSSEKDGVVSWNSR